MGHDTSTRGCYRQQGLGEGQRGLVELLSLLADCGLRRGETAPSASLELEPAE